MMQKIMMMVMVIVLSVGKCEEKGYIKVEIPHIEIEIQITIDKDLDEKELHEKWEYFKKGGVIKELLEILAASFIFLRNFFVFYNSNCRLNFLLRRKLD